MIIFMQLKLLIGLFLLTSVPYFLMLNFLPFKVEYLYLFFIILLLGIRFGIYTDSMFKEKINTELKSKLSAQLKRTPSTNEIVKRQRDELSARDLAFSVNIAIVLLITAFLAKF